MTEHYFRTLSLTVNTECGMQCPHCDLPVYRRSSHEHLSPDSWAGLLDQILPVIRPEVVALAAREPLFDARTRDVTKRVLQTAQNHGIRSGLVSNGTNINTFFQELDPQFRFDYMDLSLEGAKEVDAESRGRTHFGTIERFLDQAAYRKHVDTVYISTTMTAVNSSEKQLVEYFSWILDHMDQPNLALLLLYPNHNVSEKLVLKAGDVKRIIRLATLVSSRFNDIFLEVFPGSVPNLCQLVEEGLLPGDDEVMRDQAGVLCGYVEENLMIRYMNPHDLLKYHLRISPEGFALSSSGIENEDYLTGNYGNLLLDEVSVVQCRVDEEIESDIASIPAACQGKRCFEICRGSNKRCPILNGTAKE